MAIKFGVMLGTFGSSVGVSKISSISSNNKEPKSSDVMPGKSNNNNVFFVCEFINLVSHVSYVSE